MRDRIIETAKQNGADIVGFADASRFSPDDAVFKIMPEVKTVIGILFRVLRGAYRGVEEGSTYYQHCTMAVENMEETVMPMALLRTAVLIEDNGFTATPQKFYQQIMKEADGTYPETRYDEIYRGVTKEVQMDFPSAAVKCGLGELGFHGSVLNDEFGPLIRYAFILTDAELESTQVSEPHLCDRCGKCIDACFGGAIDKNGHIDAWQCSAYYKGANGLKNPFMPPDAFAEIEDRIDIIAGKAKLSPERAREIIDRLTFYPSISHGYQCCLCGKACDVACYIHLAKKGVLKRTPGENFTKQQDWKFDIKDFEL